MCHSCGIRNPLGRVVAEGAAIRAHLVEPVELASTFARAGSGIDSHIGASLAGRRVLTTHRNEAPSDSTASRQRNDSVVMLSDRRGLLGDGRRFSRSVRDSPRSPDRGLDRGTDIAVVQIAAHGQIVR